MLRNAYHVVLTPPGAVAWLPCRVCGAAMEVSRNQVGLTGWASALGGIPPWLPHDAFWCASADEEWHRQASELLRRLDATVDPAVRHLLEQQIHEVLTNRQGPRRAG
jgi:hypothetical protein